MNWNGSHRINSNMCKRVASIHRTLGESRKIPMVILNILHRLLAAINEICWMGHIASCMPAL